jgi:hypothetical protein
MIRNVQKFFKRKTSVRNWRRLKKKLKIQFSIQHSPIFEIKFLVGWFPGFRLCAFADGDEYGVLVRRNRPGKTYLLGEKPVPLRNKDQKDALFSLNLFK